MCVGGKVCMGVCACATCEERTHGFCCGSGQETKPRACATCDERTHGLVVVRGKTQSLSWLSPKSHVICLHLVPGQLRALSRVTFKGAHKSLTHGTIFAKIESWSARRSSLPSLAVTPAAPTNRAMANADWALCPLSLRKRPPQRLILNHEIC